MSSTTTRSTLQKLLDKVNNRKSTCMDLADSMTGDESTIPARLVTLGNAGAYAVVIRDIEAALAGASS